MSWLSELHTAAAPIVATFSPEPISRAAAQQKVRMDQEKKAKEQRLIEEQRQEQRRRQIMEYDIQATPGVNSQANMNAASTQSSGGGFLDSVSGFFGDAGRVISSAFSSGIPQLFGVSRPPSTIQQPAITTTTNMGAAETQQSGSIQAFMPGLPQIAQFGSRLLGSRGAQFGVGTAVGMLPGLINPDGTKKRITRKMKSQAKMVLNLTGGNLEAAAQILNISRDMLIFVLLKRFRNDGAVVTKAALRKTKSTVRKLKHMCDMYDDLRPAARRRAPARRRSTTTLISNK